MFSQVYLQFGNKNTHPMQTVSVEHKEHVTAAMAQRMLYGGFTRTGYGSKIPTSYMVRYNNRWYRVYSVCYSNVSTEYILINKEKVTVQFY